jgi:two-component system osmolarity sensor histidine kinase EnvZ
MLSSIPPQYRRSVSEGLRDSGTVQVFPADSTHPPGDASAQPPTERRGLLARLFGTPAIDQLYVAAGLRRYATPPVEVVRASEPAAGYWVSQVIGGEKWWIVVLNDGPPPAAGRVPWPAVAAVLLGLLAIAALYAASITRPLRQLAAATHRIGDSWPDPVNVDGPAELRDLADSFNDMLVRLRQIEGERRVLLGGLPHDLRAPLTRLRLRIETLAELDAQPGIIEDIAAIDRIVRQFTEYLRGVQPDEPRAPLDDIVRSAVDAYRSIGIDVRAADNLDARASLPRFAVRRLLDNLIDNAVQHGRAPVLVGVAAAAGAMVEVSVTDHGDGMAAELAETALEPFTKLDPARGRGGCGLGLAIVRQLARQLGGGVRFEKRADSFSVVVTLGVD